MQAPIALTCGEPSGIGPEIAEHAWRALAGDVPFFYIGDARHLPGQVPIRLIDSPEEALSQPGALPVLDHPFSDGAAAGSPSPANASSVIAVIRQAVDLVMSGRASAVCTAPIHKKALVEGAGFTFPGHTEFLAHLAGVDRVVMMLASDELRVVPTTIHIPLSDVPTTLTPDLLERTVRITDAALRRDFGLAKPRIAVTGLNPHAGEGGVMGMEDADIIAPVIDKLRREGMKVSGPHSADTLFHAAARANYDAAIAMYHDQALIPIKTLAFDSGVNVTLGLPFVRTSPDHGTALDIAGRGIAKPDSLVAALRLAQQMVRARAA